VVLDNSFVAPDGHMVFETDSFDDGAVRINYYDTETGWMLPEDLTSRQAAIEQDKTFAQDGYSKLEHLPMITLSDGTKVFNFVDTKGVCFHPYAAFITIQRPDASVIQRALYFKLDQPETINAADDESTAPHPILASHTCGHKSTLMRSFSQEPAFFFADNAGGFFALISRYAIHFDGNGNTGFFNGRENPILLSFEDTAQLRGVLTQANDSRKPQAVINTANVLIERAGEAQNETQAQEEAQ